MRASYLEDLLLMKKSKTKVTENKERKGALHDLVDSEFTYTNELDATIEASFSFKNFHNL